MKAGDRVRLGQVLGLLGNSGSSDVPHLHFHVSRAPKLDIGEGLPFEFDAFALLGHTDLVATVALGDQPVAWKPGAGPLAIRRHEIPFENDVIGFH